MIRIENLKKTYNKGKPNEEGKTVIIVTHNPMVAEACHKVYTISDGVIK